MGDAVDIMPVVFTSQMFHGIHFRLGHPATLGRETNPILKRNASKLPPRRKASVEANGPPRLPYIIYYTSASIRYPTGEWLLTCTLFVSSFWHLTENSRRSADLAHGSPWIYLINFWFLICIKKQKFTSLAQGLLHKHILSTTRTRFGVLFTGKEFHSGAKTPQPPTRTVLCLRTVYLMSVCLCGLLFLVLFRQDCGRTGLFMAIFNRGVFNVRTVLTLLVQKCKAPGHTLNTSNTSAQ